MFAASPIASKLEDMASDCEKRKISDLRVVDLKAELERRGLDKTGVKALLIERLQGALKKEGHDPDTYIFEASEKRTVKRSTSLLKQDMDAESENMSAAEDTLENRDTENEERSTSATDEQIKQENIVEDSNTEENTEMKETESDKGETPCPAVEDVLVKQQEAEESTAEANEEATLPTSDSKENTVDPDNQSHQESNLDNEDSINLTLGEDEEKLLIEEEDNSFQEKAVKDTSIRRSQDSALQSSGSKQCASTKDGESSTKSQSTKGDSSATSDRKLCSNEEISKDERRQSLKTEEESTPSQQQQQSTQQDPDGKTPSDKSRSDAAKDLKLQHETEKETKGRSPGPSGSRNLWVSGLSSSTRATDLKQTFSKFGKVIGAKIVTNARTPGARCYGFITMSTSEDAFKCIVNLDRTELHGRMISVEKAKGDNSGPSRPKPPGSPTVDTKTSERRKSQTSESDKKTDSIRSDDKPRSRSKDRLARPQRQRITAPSPGPNGPGRSDPDVKRRPRSRSPNRPPPKRRESPHFDRKSNSGVLTFQHIKEERERQRMRERDREMREEARRRREEMERQKSNERRQREEALRLEREREELRLERERLKRAREDLLKLERERQRVEREKLECEKEELRRTQLRLRELAMVERSVPVTPPPVAGATNARWSSSSAGDLGPSSRYDDPTSRRNAPKRPSDIRPEYFEDRPSKRANSSANQSVSNNDRRAGSSSAYDVPQTPPPPPRFNSGPSSKRGSDGRHDTDYSRGGAAGRFERSGAGNSGPNVSGSNFDRPTSGSRRDSYFDRGNNSAGRGGGDNRRDMDTNRNNKDERYPHPRDTFRGGPRSGNERDGPMDSRGGGAGGSSARRGNSRDRYSNDAGPRGDSRYQDWTSDRHSSSLSGSKPFSGTQSLMGSSVGGTSSRDPWSVQNDRKNDSGGSWGRGNMDSGNGHRWGSSGSGIGGVPSRNAGGNIYPTPVAPLASLNLGMSGPGAPGFAGGNDRFDTYKSINNIRKY